MNTECSAVQWSDLARSTFRCRCRCRCMQVLQVLLLFVVRCLLLDAWKFIRGNEFVQIRGYHLVLCRLSMLSRGEWRVASGCWFAGIK